MSSASTADPTKDRTANRDYTLIIDKSGSMSTHDVDGKSRWEAVQESTLAVAEHVSKLDPDGLTIYLFASTFTRYDNVKPDKVRDIFAEHNPMGRTDLTSVLNHALADWKQRKSLKQLKSGDTILVITDGIPDDEESVASAIKGITKTMDGEEELAISFLQIGQDSHAAAYLRRLDDGLQSEGAKFDIVDTKTFSDLEKMSMTEVLLAALDD